MTDPAEYLSRGLQHYIDERGEGRAPVSSERPTPAVPLLEPPIECDPATPATATANTDTVAPPAALHTSDVASFLGCSTRTVLERTRLAEIPHRKVAGCRRLLFFESELREWLDGAALETEYQKGDGRTVRPKRAAA